jgi:hypothetical protein
MASKGKAERMGQKAYWEVKLERRLTVLGEKGLEPAKISKDAVIRKIRAKMREADLRLKAITDLERQTEDLARAKAEKMAAPKKEKSKKRKAPDEAPVMSKRQQKKRKKKEGNG